MSEIRSAPCTACPYRRDVPSGIWAAEEYEKLPEYDGETWEQPTAAFSCHATPDVLCHGWAVVGGDDLLALRLEAARAGKVIEIPEPAVPLFDSGTEAAAHGVRDIDAPDAAACVTIERLVRKYDRLRATVT